MLSGLGTKSKERRWRINPGGRRCFSGLYHTVAVDSVLPTGTSWRPPSGPGGIRGLGFLQVVPGLMLVSWVAPSLSKHNSEGNAQRRNGTGQGHRSRIFHSRSSFKASLPAPTRPEVTPSSAGTPLGPHCCWQQQLFFGTTASPDLCLGWGGGCPGAEP